MEAGLRSGTVFFEYEDAVGEKHVIEKTFEIEVMEQVYNDTEGELGYEEFPMGEFDPNNPMNPEGQNKSKLWMIIAGIGLVLFVVAIIILRKRKKKKEMMFNE
jgi:LPXTG-motif cell wall-anchored protein